jgi:hypothetical protein
MRPVTLDEALFGDLARTTGEGLVSVLIPTHVKGPETAQDRIRLKNALNDVDEMLEQAGWRRKDREERLARARALESDDEFWAHQDHGLALYIDEACQIVPVALGDEPPAVVTIADGFHVRHLLGCLMRVTLPALVLTKGEVALYAIGARRADVVKADLPSSFEDVNWFTDREPQMSRHADRAGSAGVQHGHDPDEQRSEDVLRFLRAVDHALNGEASRGPLAVLGDEPLVDGFKRISEREIVDLRLDGSAASTSEAEVWKRVRPVIEDRMRAKLAANNAAARTALGTADVVTILPDILYAGVSGRLSDLYVKRDTRPIWGRFDQTALDAVAGAALEVGTVDLVDRLVVCARATGAEVHLMEGDADGCDFVGVRRF